MKHQKLTCVEYSVSRRKERVYTCLPFRLNDEFGVTNNDVRTAECALMERLFFLKKNGVVRNRIDVKYENVCEKLSTFKAELYRNLFHPAKMTAQQFVSMYSGRMRTRYEDAMISLCKGDVTEKDALSKTFIKFEKVKTDKAPRIIQPRDPRYNLSLGCYLKHIEKRVYKRIQRVYNVEDPVVLKGLNVRQVAQIIQRKWDQFVEPVAIGLDATRFDMHVSQGMLQWEHDYYIKLYRHDAKLRKLLSWQLVNKGVAYLDDGKIKYTIEGCRLSGDMNTALGNCLIMCAMVYSWMIEKGIKFDLINNGDDCVLFIERRHLTKVSDCKEWFEEVGFRMEIEPPVYELEQIEFCQMKPVKLVDGYCMCRNWITSLNKDSMCIKGLVGKGLKRWVYAVGECGLKTFGAMPILSVFYSKLTKIGIKNSKTSKDLSLQSGLRLYWGNGIDYSNYEIEEETRYSFYLAFGVTPDEQIALENEISKMRVDLDKLSENEETFLRYEIPW